MTSRFPAITLAFFKQDAVGARDAKLEALGHTTGALDEPLRGEGWTKVARRFLEQHKPSIEVI